MSKFAGQPCRCHANSGGHSFNETDLRCPCGVTWFAQQINPTDCAQHAIKQNTMAARARAANKRKGVTDDD